MPPAMYTPPKEPVVNAKLPEKLPNILQNCDNACWHIGQVPAIA